MGVTMDVTMGVTTGVTMSVTIAVTADGGAGGIDDRGGRERRLSGR